MSVTGNLQTKNGKYYAVINLHDENGKRRQKWINTNLPLRGNKKAAEAFLNEQVAKYEQVIVPYSKLTVAEYFGQWLSQMAGKVRANTYRNYCGNMQNHIIPYFQCKKILLQELTAVDLEEYYESKLQKGSKLKTEEALSPHNDQAPPSKYQQGALRRGSRPADCLESGVLGQDAKAGTYKEV